MHLAVSVLQGQSVVDRLMVLLMNYPLAFKKLLPSIQPKSLAAGTIAAVSVWAVVYFKGKMERSFARVKNMVLPDGEMKRI